MKRFLAFLATTLGMATITHAMPVQYDLTYQAEATTGRGGFWFDHDSGVLTDFMWRFDGAIGGIEDNHFGFTVLGDTRGRYLFELLSGWDVHAGVDCSSVIAVCANGDSIAGEAPFGASTVIFYRQDGIASFEFSDGPNTLLSGLVTFAQVPPVPEPATLALLAIGVLAIGAVRRRRPA